MQDDNTKKPEQSDKNVPAADKVEELSEKPISESDAQAVKGGYYRIWVKDAKSPV